MYVIDSEHTFIDWPDDKCRYGALILFFAGCDFNCKGCHNVQFKQHRKERHTIDMIKDLIHFKGLVMPKNRYEHLILSGGDPFSEINYPDVKKLIDELPDYKIMVYTGQEVAKVTQLDVNGPVYYKCGKFIEKRYQTPGHLDGAFYLASTNQVLLNQNKDIISTDGVYRYA